MSNPKPIKTKYFYPADLVYACGGPGAIARKTKVSVWAVYQWLVRGIPQKHWETFCELTDITPGEIYAMNRRLTK